jgi:uncharacterized protein (DUF433 family)
MANDSTKPETRFEEWAASIGVSTEEVASAWQDLERRGLARVSAGQVTLSPLAMRRSTSDTQRRLAAHLAGYLLTENSFIVRRSGDPAGFASILNTRIAVEQIANYFKAGWGVTEIERDLPILTREEIEAAIQYYLNHPAEIEQEMRNSRELYELNAPKPEMTSV